MADFNPKSLFLSISLLFSLIFIPILVQSEQSEVIEQVRSEVRDDSSAIQFEFDQLKAKIQLLETRLDESNQNLKTKDVKIANLEVVTREKSHLVASLQSEVKAVQKKQTSDAEERVGKAQARATELQKEVEKLKKEIERQNKEKEALEGRIEESDKKIEKLNSELEKINDAQKIIIRNSEQAYQVLKEELLQARLEASARHLELNEVHCAWLPPWLVDRALRSKAFVEVEWIEHGKPVMEIFIQKTLEKKDQATKWAEPHIETVKNKLVPAMKEQWVMVTEYVEPHVKSLTAKTLEVFEASKTAVKPHIITVQELADPYYQDVKRASKPYIDHVATVAKPHVEKARTVLKPYTKKAVHVYGKFLESATMYYHQVQAAVHEKLKQHDVTKALATNETFIVICALLAINVILTYRVCSRVFCWFNKKSKKPSRNSHAHHARRKAKRGHSDK